MNDPIGYVINYQRRDSILYCPECAQNACDSWGYPTLDPTPEQEEEFDYSVIAIFGWDEVSGSCDTCHEPIE